MKRFVRLIEDIRACELCSADLPLGPRPVLQAHPSARILIVGQAPGTAVHRTGIPFNDPSGDRLRDWLGVSRETFYDPRQIALIPMGFCYPGKGSGGDLPPLPRCAEVWRAQSLEHLQRVELTVLVGRYAIDWHLPERRRDPLTAVAGDWASYLPGLLPLPHPSPRNLMWLRKNPWLEERTIPVLHERVAQILK